MRSKKTILDRARSVVAVITLVLCSSIPVVADWRPLPVISPKFQRTIGTGTRFVDALISLNWFTNKDVHMPLYELGAPREIFTINLVNSQVTFDSMTFIRTGHFWKLAPYAISQQISDQELLSAIRQTTGIQEPYGRTRSSFLSHTDVHLTIALCMLRAQAIFTKVSVTDPQVHTALQRPFIFISSLVTNQMLLETFYTITWKDIFQNIEPSSQEINRYAIAFKRWRRSIEQILKTSITDQEILCCV